MNARAAPRLEAIFAVAENHVIGRAGQLPWDYPEDRAHFRRITLGHVVILGRRTWDEVGSPLEGRHNVVVSRSFEPPPGVLVAPSLEAALETAASLGPLAFVIGGARLFSEAMPRVERVYVTRIPGRPAGDVFFEFDPSPFELVQESRGASGLVFQVYDRARNLARSP